MFSFALIPIHVFAQIDATSGGSGGIDATSNGNGSGSAPSIKLENPLAGGGINDIPTLVQEILNIVLTIGVPLIVVAIIYAGYKFIAAQGNSEKLKEAKNTLVYVLVGAAILLAAYAIASVIVSTVTAIRG